MQMLISLTLLIFSFVIIGCVSSLEINPNISEEDIIFCEEKSDCIVVPYSHCCGTSKKAINKKYLEIYNSRPEWQKFDDPDVCAVIGICAPDEDLNSAICQNGKCQLST